MSTYQYVIHNLADPTAIAPVDPSMKGDAHAIFMYERRGGAPAIPEVMIEHGEKMTENESAVRLQISTTTPYFIPVYGITVLHRASNSSHIAARVVMLIIRRDDVWRLRTVLWLCTHSTPNIPQRLAKVLLPQYEKGKDARRQFLRFFPEDAPLAAYVFFPDERRVFVHEGVTLSADGAVVTRDGEILRDYNATWESRPPYKP